MLASTTAAANTVPQAGEDGTLDASWVPRPDCWDMFPPFVPVPIWGATPGGSDGRRAIMPGEEQAREEWFLCDGGSDGKDGTVPGLRGRYVRGASEAEPEGTEGGQRRCRCGSFRQYRGHDAEYNADAQPHAPVYCRHID